MVETIDGMEKDCYLEYMQKFRVNIRRLKTAYRSTIAEEREGNLNLMQLQGIVEIDTVEVANIFIKRRKRRLIHNLHPSQQALYFFHKGRMMRN